MNYRINNLVSDSFVKKLQKIKNEKIIGVRIKNLTKRYYRKNKTPKRKPRKCLKPPSLAFLRKAFVYPLLLKVPFRKIRFTRYFQRKHRLTHNK